MDCLIKERQWLKYICILKTLLHLILFIFRSEENKGSNGNSKYKEGKKNKYEGKTQKYSKKNKENKYNKREEGALDNSEVRVEENVAKPLKTQDKKVNKKENKESQKQEKQNKPNESGKPKPVQGQDKKIEKNVPKKVKRSVEEPTPVVVKTEKNEDLVEDVNVEKQASCGNSGAETLEAEAEQSEMCNSQTEDCGDEELMEEQNEIIS